MNKKNKGDFGYLNYKKKLNFIIAAVCFTYNNRCIYNWSYNI